MRSLLVLPMVLLGISSASAESLQIGDEHYAETCSTQEWLLVAGQLKIVANTRSPQLLIKLAKAYLCDQGKKTKKYLIQFSNKNLISTSEGSGQEKTEDSLPSNETIHPQAGQAWNATVQDDYPDVKLLYFSNEACVRSVTFKPIKGNWVIMGTGEACD